MKGRNISSASPATRRSILTFITLILLLYAVACSSSPPQDEPTEPDSGGQPTQSTADAPPVDPSDPSDPIPSDNIYPSPDEKMTPEKGNSVASHDRGAFLVEYRAPTNPDYVSIEEALQKSRVLEHVADNLNDELALPTNVTLVAHECGVVNAFYDPAKKELSLCYELVQQFADMYNQIEGQSQEEFVSGVFSAMTLVLYHEIGHALVDVMEIKTPGRPEDVVDQLAVFMLLKKGGDEGARMAMKGARYFALSARQRDARSIAFWDEHSTDETRFFNIYCWIYGSDEKKYAPLVDSGILPAQRAAKCSEEYTQLSQGWQRLLAPHMKHT